MGMKQTRWVAAKQTDVKQIIGKRRIKWDDIESVIPA